MSTQKLRDELHRIGESAPVADVRVDTWARARRARTRDRLLAGAAAVAVLALVAGFAGVLPDPESTPVADSSAPGLPNHLYAVPDRLSGRDGDENWASDEVTSDITTGVAAASWVTPAGGLPVVVDAAHGGYHLLDLPGYAGNNWMMSGGLYEPSVALSPDGRRLAYSWATFGPDAATKPIPSGIRVVDLITGALNEFALPGNEGTAVTAIAWSHDGNRIAWAGGRLASWTTESIGSGAPVAGRISLTTGTKQEFAPRRVGTSDVAVGIDDRGRVVLADGGTLLTWDGGRRTLSNDSGAVLSGMAPASSRGEVALPMYGEGAFTVTDGRSRRVVDVGIRAHESRVQPLGWVGADVLVLTDHNNGSGGDLRLVPVDGGPSHVVGTVDGGLNPSLTVAIDLVTSDRPTVERPGPEWPWSTERWVATVGLGVLGLLLLGALVTRLWRRTRPM